jgi:hypothetical protein
MNKLSTPIYARNTYLEAEEDKVTVTYYSFWRSLENPERNMDFAAS